MKGSVVTDLDALFYRMDEDVRNLMKLMVEDKWIKHNSMVFPISVYLPLPKIYFAEYTKNKTFIYIS